jgi:DNA-binding beta-propeller fold protein YncE
MNKIIICFIIIISLFFVNCNDNILSNWSFIYYSPEGKPVGLVYVDGVLWLTTWNHLGSGAGLWKLDADTGEVIQRFPPISDAHEDLAWDGENLWCCDWFDNEIYVVDPTTGQTTATYEGPGERPVGMTYDNGYIWLGDTETDCIYKINIETLEPEFYFNFTAGKPEGIAFDGTYLYINDFNTNKMYKYTTSGDLIGEYTACDEEPEGLAYDGEYLYSASWKTLKIFRITPP